MAEGDISVEGIDKLMKQFKKFKDLNVSRTCLVGAEVLRKYSMENAPVDTGFLRSSHTSETTDEGAVMKVQAEYAFYVEYGTAKKEANPFVRTAIDEHQKEILSAMKDDMEAQIKELKGG